MEKLAHHITVNVHERHALLKACFRSHMWSFLSPVIPRLCLSAFTFAQPFLINTTVSLADQRDSIGDLGKYLIGAWALVYLGVAVCNLPLRRFGTDFLTFNIGIGFCNLLSAFSIHYPASGRLDCTCISNSLTNTCGRLGRGNTTGAPGHRH